MDDIWFLPEFLFDGHNLHENRALKIGSGVVEAVLPASHAPADACTVQGILSPGFIDLQVNGGGGVLFNDNPTPEGIAAIMAAHRAFGTTEILPTVITDEPIVMMRAVDAVIEAIDRPGLLGIHIEGPHISIQRLGTHAEHYVRPMDDTTIAHVERLREADIAVMITIAPEAVNSEQIKRLSASGAVVSLGHSDATAEQTRQAIRDGVSCATHLFNAMSPMLNRLPGVTGAVINSDIAAGIIADGIHVADEMIALAMRARPKKDKMFLVSDAMPTVGGGNRFDLYGTEICLKDGRLINEEGSLAGAHLTQADGLYRLVNIIGIERTEALRAVITVPSQVIGKPERADIVGKLLGDIIHLESDLRFIGYLH